MFKKEKIKDLHYSVNGVIPADKLQDAADEILLEYGKKVKMPGFRTGKVPLNILRQKYNASAYGEAIDKLMNDDLNNYIAEKKIRLAGAPKADLAGWEIGKDAEYSMEFDILPTLPAIDLEKFTITKKVAELDEKEVETALENIRKSRSVAEKQDEKYKAANGDVAVIDFKGFVGDDAFEGGEAKKHHLILGSGAFIPGFEDQIIGMNIGGERDITVKFPEDYPQETLAGKEAVFAIKLHGIKVKELPEVNDEFIQEATGEESVEAYKASVKAKLQ